MVLTGVTYGIKPYGHSLTGWGDPFVLEMILGGLALLIAFAFIETKVPESMSVPYGLKIADLGLEEACRKNPDLKEGLNVYGSHVTYPGCRKGVRSCLRVSGYATVRGNAAGPD